MNRNLALKYILPNNDVYISTVPLASDNSNHKSKKFIFQQLRSSDLGLSVSPSDIIKVEVYSYPKEMKYMITYFENITKHNIKLLGSYNFTVNIENEQNVFGMKKGEVSAILNREHNVKLTFTSIYHPEYKTYVLSNPLIEGNVSFII